MIRCVKAGHTNVQVNWIERSRRRLNIGTHERLLAPISLTNDVGKRCTGSAKPRLFAKQVLYQLSYIPLLTCGFA
jgi:hypothetical protein